MTESLQSKMNRVRPPRVRITYDVDVEGATSKRELPLIVGVLAHLSGVPAAPLPPLDDRQFVDIDRDNFDEVMASCRPRLLLDVVDVLAYPPGTTTSAEFSFSCLEDFAPLGLVRQMEGAANLLRLRTHLTNGRVNLEGEAEGSAVRVAEIDQLLTRQANHVMQEPAFRRLEAMWRGLYFLVANSETGPGLRLRVLNVTQQELRDDLASASAPGQSALAKKLNTKDGKDDPVSFLVGAYEVSDREGDADFLEGMASVAAAATAPFLTSAPAEGGGPDRQSEADSGEMPSMHPFTQWRCLGSDGSARFVALASPEFKLRPSYDPEVYPAEGFAFREAGTSDGDAGALWGNAAFALGQRITSAFSLHGWLAAIHGDGEDSAADRRRADAAELPSLLNAARFAQYITVIMRDRGASFPNVQEASDFLNTWISQYVLLEDDAPVAVQARYPLRQARVSVTERSGMALGAEITLTPCFQVEGALVPVSLMIDLPG